MKITKEMLDPLAVPERIAVELMQRYMVYVTEPSPFVIQQHILTRSRNTLYPSTGSQHLDFRMKVDDHLVGWSIVGGSVEDPITIERLIENTGKGFRVETKASQPLVWLDVGSKREFVKTSGESPGIMEVLTRGEYVTGALKPYFFEYFIKDGKYFQDWTRIIVRGILVNKLDPETKKPLGTKERLFILMIPKDQKPYALSRGMKKRWKPPSHVRYPFPYEWAVSRWKDDVKRWELFIDGKDVELSTTRFALALVSWMGPVAKTHRQIPQMRWYILIDDRNSPTVRVFMLDGYPIKDQVMTAYEVDRASKKYLDYDGIIEPNTRFNPNKELSGKYSLIDSGTVVYDPNVDSNGTETITMVLKGKRISGKYVMYQEESGSDVYVMEKTDSTLSISGTFVYDLHEFPAGSGNRHMDLRFMIGDRILEFNIRSPIPESIVETRVQSILKLCNDPEWMKIKTTGTIMKAYGVNSVVETIDNGTVDILDFSNDVIMMYLRGKILDGIFTAKKTDGMWTLGKEVVTVTSLETISELVSSNGNPITGVPYDPPIVEYRRGWDKIRVHLYDIRKFTRVEPDSKVKEYIKDLKIPDGVSVAIGLYPVQGRIHHARIAYVDFSTDKWTTDTAIRFIKDTRLDKFESVAIRG